jgi:hypothetical protein
MYTSAQQINTGSVTPGLVRLSQIPSINFVGKNIRLNEENKQLLAHLAKVIRNNPDYRFSLTGYCIGKYQIQQSGLRMNSIVRYLVDTQAIFVFALCSGNYRYTILALFVCCKMFNEISSTAAIHNGNAFNITCHINQFEIKIATFSLFLPDEYPVLGLAQSRDSLA